jgi:hypothetical protein
MPFTRLQELGALANAVHTAMDRNDDIGMDMLRDLLPEVRETIDSVNAALREVDGLLFEGLRDEALVLNDPEFPALAARLHLEDRATWPAVEAFFTAEGINLPPKIDFDTLTSIESAHAELEHLRQPLDKLRRLNLERAPLQRRLAQLRKLRELDPTKPVWAQAAAAHEEARAAELHDAVRRAIDARDPHALAELHAEVVDPEWSIPVPRELVRNTRGAEIWMRMRDAAARATAAATSLEARDVERQHAPPTTDLLYRQQQARQDWMEAEAIMQECAAALPQCPQIAAIVADEGLDRVIASQASRVEPALQWLTAQDQREGIVLQHQQLCGQIEYLVDHPPKAPQDETKWMAGLRRLESDLVRCCQAESSLGFPDLLRERVRAALAEVKGREARRRRLRIMMVAAGVVTFVGLVLGLWLWRDSATRRAGMLAELASMRQQAEQGAYELMPAAVAAWDAYADDGEFTRERGKLEAEVAREQKRRVAVSKALDRFESAVERGQAELAARRASGDACLQPWHESVVEAAEAWREARRLGGLPSKREPPDTGPLALERRPNAAQDVLKAEEARIEAARSKQIDLEQDYGAAALEEFRRQWKVIESAVPQPGTEDRAAVAAKLLDDLAALVKRTEEPKADRIDRLLGDPLRKRTVPYLEVEPALLLEKTLKRLADKAAGP